MKETALFSLGWQEYKYRFRFFAQQMPLGRIGYQVASATGNSDGLRVSRMGFWSQLCL
jgi:hypothetical protein